MAAFLAPAWLEWEPPVENTASPWLKISAVVIKTEREGESYQIVPWKDMDKDYIKERICKPGMCFSPTVSISIFCEMAFNI